MNFNNGENFIHVYTCFCSFSTESYTIRRRCEEFTYFEFEGKQIISQLQIILRTFLNLPKYFSKSQITKPFTPCNLQTFDIVYIFNVKANVEAKVKLRLRLRPRLGLSRGRGKRGLRLRPMLILGLGLVLGLGLCFR